MKTMTETLRPAIASLALFTVLCGVVYPLFSTAMLQSLFSSQSQGSLIMGKDGKALGSELIGQNFSDPKYFWGRLSATSPYAYNAINSSGSNFGSNNPALTDAVKGRVEALKAADADNHKPIPVDLATASGSGVDPHISPAAAEYQLARVAKARGLDEAKLRQLVEKYTQGRQFGVLGEPTVNVFELNLALDGKM
jgi:K+-transporting ATPase ATPase C chain